MSRRPGLGYNKILAIHADWLRDNGYKLQAASCKLQAASYKQSVDKRQLLAYKRRIIKENYVS